MHCPSPRPRHPTCPTVTRAPRLDAIVAPENSFLKPSVDRGQARPWGTAHTPSPPRSPLPHPSPASHVKHCVSQQYICQAHGNGVPSGQLHPLPLLLIPPACSSSFIPAAPRQRLSQRCGRAAMPCAIARCCSDALSPTGPWLPRPLPSPLLSHRSPPQHSCRAGSPPLQPTQPHLPAGHGTCHPGHGNSCKEQEGEMSGAEIPPRAAPPQHCLPPALQHPLPTHFRRRWAGCLTSFCILQGRAGGCHVFMGGCGGGDTCPPAALSWALLRAAAPSQRTSSSLPGPCLGPSHRSGSCPSRAGDPHQNLL